MSTATQEVRDYAVKLFSKGFSVDELAGFTKRPVEEIEGWVKEEFPDADDESLHKHSSEW